MPLSSIGDGWRLFKDTWATLVRYPVFLLPIFLSWLVFAAIILFDRYYYGFPSSLALGLLCVYLMLLVASLVICAAGLLMLELMQQIESGKPVSLAAALKETLGFDLIRMIPIAVIWSILWFIILILIALTSRKKRGGKAEPSLHDAARTLGGADGESFSFARLGLRLIEKLIRMVAFMSLPAIAWENKGPFSAMGRAIEIIRKHPVEFLTLYSLTGLAALVMGIPLGIIFAMDDHGVHFSNAVWTGVIIYAGMVWTLGIYLEQMTVAMLYLWHLKWLKNGATGPLSTVPRPDLLDNYHELKD